MSGRIYLEPDEVAGMIRGAKLLELRPDTPREEHRQRIEVALTAMDALCGLADRDGMDAVWDALELLTRRELLAFATLMAPELSRAGFSIEGRIAGAAGAEGSTGGESDQR